MLLLIKMSPFYEIYSEVSSNYDSEDNSANSSLIKKQIIFFEKIIKKTKNNENIPMDFKIKIKSGSITPVLRFNSQQRIQDEIHFKEPVLQESPGFLFYELNIFIKNFHKREGWYFSEKPFVEENSKSGKDIMYEAFDSKTKEKIMNVTIYLMNILKDSKGKILLDYYEIFEEINDDENIENIKIDVKCYVRDDKKENSFSLNLPEIKFSKEELKEYSNWLISKHNEITGSKIRELGKINVDIDSLIFHKTGNKSIKISHSFEEGINLKRTISITGGDLIGGNSRNEATVLMTVLVNREGKTVKIKDANFIKGICIWELPSDKDNLN